MALPLAFLLALVVLSCKNTCSLGCDLPQIHNLGLETPEKNEEGALTLLQKMRRIPTFCCLNDRKDFAFPQKLLEGEKVPRAQAVAVLQEMTHQIFRLFGTQEAFAAWDKTLLDTFLSGLHQHLEDLKACVTHQVRRQKALGITVRKYFRRITDYLKENEYLPCAWEMVRTEIMKFLSSSPKLYERLRSMERDLVQQGNASP
ncbi:interferon alpha-5-like [Marmota marmota marmota]|uniref:Interferon alpha-2-like n=1 Tax=Marmota marmota marmota TaxID=9994 RepID=A0A8C6EQ66_MARMA|nr:interferon alpha-5-like [Marmota marmota marmota]